MKLRTLNVAGIMSGTSADGIDVALVRIEPGPPRNAGKTLFQAGSKLFGASIKVTTGKEPAESEEQPLALTLLHYASHPFPDDLREAVLAAQDAENLATRDLARLHWRLGLAYVEAYTAVLKAFPVEVDLVGCHGQTVYHQAAPAEYLGASFPCTWQIGEMAPLAAAAGVRVYSNFRPADLVAGGQGAPLVPLLDATFYQHPARTRVLLNIGGIANLTVVSPSGPVQAFDTGPGNMIVDALAAQLCARPYDAGGEIAARGAVIAPALATLLREPFFAAPPPKTAGREQFGPAFTARLLALCREHSARAEDALATATALTARSIALAVPPEACDLIVSGGGAKNLTLQRMIAEAVPQAAVKNSDDPFLPTPLPVEAKEAAAFALLAYMSRHRLPGNIPSATGAHRAVILGQLTRA